MDIRRYTNIKQEGWQEIWALYQDSFPECERRLECDQAAAMCDPSFYATGLWDNGAFAGLLFYWYHEEFCYVEHFAINQKIRGQGYGTRSLEALCGQYPLVILEIELPVDALTLRRQHFYERFGFLVSRYQHSHPPYRFQDAPHELLALSYPSPLTPQLQQKFLQYRETHVMQYSEPGRVSRG